MRQAEKEGLAAPALKRLKFDEHKLGDVCAGLEQLAAMDDPIGQEQLRAELADGAGAFAHQLPHRRGRRDL